MTRVAVTGIGVISAIGNTRETFWEALVAGRPGFSALDPMFGYSVRFKGAARVRDYDPEAHFSRELAYLDRFGQFAVVAAREAVAHAGIEWTPDLLENTAIVTGSCMGGRAVEENGYWELFHCERNRVHPLTIPMSMSNAGASQIAVDLHIQGPAFTISTACASSAHALGQAFSLVQSGAAPMAIAGGSEAPLFLGGLKAWEAMRVVSTDTCRPFSANRSGLMLGEGAAMLVLEPLEAALARGARPLAELAGFGMSADAAHITQPSAAGEARALRAALRTAGLHPEQIGYVNAHGTATEINDRVEVASLRCVFEKHADRMAISSTKSMHGHTLGAAGAMEASATVMGLERGILPPTANFTTPDPACDMDVIPNEARRQQVEAALSSSFAFGGLNAVLAFRALP
jgi:nodulation protein E